MMLNGVIYTSDELHALGVVDVLAPRGEGVRAVDELMRRHQRIARARMATNRIRERVNPVTLTELMQVTELWVEEALGVNERQLKTMERLVRAQLKRPDAPASSADADD